MNKTDYYSADELLKVEAHYYISFGMRSNGKTYDTLKRALKNYFDNGKQFAYVRRMSEDFKVGRGDSIFYGLIANDEVKKLSNGAWTGTYFYRNRWYLTKKDDKGNIIKSAEPIGFAFSISNMEHDKGGSYPNVTMIIFDEFMTRKNYLNDEFNLFMNVVSTIVRQRDDVKIFMLGNTVNKYCPYFTNMGINIEDMKPGDIKTYKYGEDGNLIVRVYYADAVAVNDSKVYFAFDNPKLKMITSGAWEVALYPTFPYKYDKDDKKIRVRPKDVLFKYYIKFNNKIVECQIINYCGDVFTFVHNHTYEIINNTQDLIYDTEYNPAINYRRRITRPQTELETKLLAFYLNEKVFYQDNEVGEIIRNYMNWCRTDKTV